RITAKWRPRRFCSTFNFPGLLQNGGFAVFAVLLLASVDRMSGHSTFSLYQKHTAECIISKWKKWKVGSF
ncbi:MAG: hypothetical protein IJS22_00620, partial [Lachnospiraceae bacterium]|nr:hypothetical protein [Lachnospiraceae bacterium]